MVNSSLNDANVCLDSAPDPTDYGIFGIVVIGGGVILQQILKSSPKLEIVPYTLTVFIFGMLLGGINIATDRGMGGLSYSMDRWLHMDPFVLLHIFLPVLLFASCFVIDYYVFKRLFFQSFLLGTYGVIFSAFGTALVAIYIFPYGFSWLEGWMFGGMFAATDTVAVVSLLKSLGAPETVGVLIEGESLLNDGTAYTLFIAFERAVAGKSTHYSADAIISEIVFEGVVGPLIGSAFALVAIVLMNIIWKDFELEIAVTLVSAYGAFFLGYHLHASGVLAVVTLGIILSAYSASYIDPQTQVRIKEFWQVADFVANTMLFGLAGFVVIETLATTHFVDGTDVGMVVILYIMLNVIRMLSIVSVWPLLKYTGYSMNWRKASIVGWAGLRGAIGLIAALTLVAECKCEDEDALGRRRLSGYGGETGNGTEHHSTNCLSTLTADRIMFHMAGVVLLTLVINGPLTKTLLRYVRLSKQTRAAWIMYRKGVYRLQKQMETSVQALKREPFFRGANWAQVWAALPVLSSEAMDELKTERMNNPMIDPESDTRVRQRLEATEKALFDDSTITVEMMIAEGRHRFLNAVKAAYMNQFKEGACSSWPAMNILSEAASRAQDHDNTPMREWDLSLKHQCEIPSYYRSNWFSRLPFRNWLVTNRIAQGFDIGTAFILAHTAAEQDIVAVTPEGIAKVILAESRHQVASARSYLRDVEESYPEIAKTFKTNLAIQRVLKKSQELAEEMLEHAELDKRDHAAIERILETSANSIQSRTKVETVNDQRALFASSYLFENVDIDLMRKIRAHAKLRSFQPDEAMITRGESTNSFYVIVRGRVEVSLKFTSVEGSIAGDYVELSSHPSQGGASASQQYHKHTGKRAVSVAMLSPPLEKDLVLIRRGASATDFEKLKVNGAIKNEDGMSDGQVEAGDGLSTVVSFNIEEENTNKVTHIMEAKTTPPPEQSTAPSRRQLLSFGRSKANVKSAKPKIVKEAEEDLEDDTAVAANLGPGDVVGEIELITEKPALSTVVCQTMVEAYEIDNEFFRTILKLHPDSHLMTNVCRQVGLVALEAHFPAFRLALFSLRRYILSHLEVIQPFPGVPMTFEAGKIVLIKGSGQDARGNRKLEAISVADVAAEEALVFTPDSYALWIPAQTCVLVQESFGNRNGRNGHSRPSSKHSTNSQLSTIRKKPSDLFSRITRFSLPIRKLFSKEALEPPVPVDATKVVVHNTSDHPSDDTSDSTPAPTANSSTPPVLPNEASIGRLSRRVGDGATVSISMDSQWSSDNPQHKSRRFSDI